MNHFPSVSIIVPVYNGGAQFVDCLDAINLYKPPKWELIVVDDGSTDHSGAVAARFGARVFKTVERGGPGAARNLGAEKAKGDWLLFVDADCEVNEFTFPNLAEEISDFPHVDAFFGSYDDTPRAPNFIAQYKNLFHRYVHQIGNEDASTFWAGCGAIRRDLFLHLGGFDVVRFSRPSIEDIDLGYRIKQCGGSIRIAKTMQVKHYKAWTLKSLVKTDVFDRGIPWTRLLLANPSCRVNELNLQTQQRISVLAVFALAGSIVAAPFYPPLLIGSLVLATLLIWSNRDVYTYFMNCRGFAFTVRVVPMHWLYYLYAGVSFGLGMLLHYFDVLIGNDRFKLREAPERPNLRVLAKAIADDK